MMRLTQSYHTRALVPTQECKDVKPGREYDMIAKMHHILGLSRPYWRRAGLYWAGAAEMELMEMSCRRPGEAWSLPAVAAPALAGEQVSRPVKPCNAPATKFSVGRMKCNPGPTGSSVATLERQWP